MANHDMTKKKMNIFQCNQREAFYLLWWKRFIPIFRMLNTAIQSDKNDLSEFHQPRKLRFCEIGAERKSKTLEVREAMFQRFTVVREKHSRLDKRVFQDCMKEYNISLRKSNKRYVIKNEDRVEEIQNYLNGGEKIFPWYLRCRSSYHQRRPNHRNERASQRTLSFKPKATFLVGNYMHSIESVTCFVQLCNDPQVKLQPYLSFKDKANWTHLHHTEGVNCQWASKRLYRIE